MGLIPTFLGWGERTDFFSRLYKSKQVKPLWRRSPAINRAEPEGVLSQVRDPLNTPANLFGFVLSQWAERNDYAVEIGTLQMQYAFETLRLARILALAHPRERFLGARAARQARDDGSLATWQNPPSWSENYFLPAQSRTSSRGTWKGVGS